jgi:GGDEF domain-containing protein
MRTQSGDRRGHPAPGDTPGDGKLVALLAVDGNGIKKANDIFGHQAGDAVVKAIAEKLETHTRQPADILARVEDDEPDTDKGGAIDPNVVSPETDLLARPGGDEFWNIVEAPPDQTLSEWNHFTEERAQRMRAQLSNPRTKPIKDHRPDERIDPIAAIGGVVGYMRDMSREEKIAYREATGVEAPDHWFAVLTIAAEAWMYKNKASIKEQELNIQTQAALEANAPPPEIDSRDARNPGEEDHMNKVLAFYEAWLEDELNKEPSTPSAAPGPNEAP